MANKKTLRIPSSCPPQRLRDVNKHSSTCGSSRIWFQATNTRTSCGWEHRLVSAKLDGFKASHAGRRKTCSRHASLKIKSRSAVLQLKIITRVPIRDGTISRTVGWWEFHIERWFRKGHKISSLRGDASRPRTTDMHPSDQWRSVWQWVRPQERLLQ